MLTSELPLEVKGHSPRLLWIRYPPVTADSFGTSTCCKRPPATLLSLSQDFFFLNPSAGESIPAPDGKWGQMKTERPSCYSSKILRQSKFCPTMCFWISSTICGWNQLERQCPPGRHPMSLEANSLRLAGSRHFENVWFSLSDEKKKKVRSPALSPWKMWTLSLLCKCLDNLKTTQSEVVVGQNRWRSTSKIFHSEMSTVMYSLEHY